MARYPSSYQPVTVEPAEAPVSATIAASASAPVSVSAAVSGNSSGQATDHWLGWFGLWHPLGAVHRWLSMSVGLVWCFLLVLLGLACWRQGWFEAALMWLSASQFVMMVLVADELCPRASILLTGLLKAIAALVFWVSFVLLFVKFI